MLRRLGEKDNSRAMDHRRWGLQGGEDADPSEYTFSTSTQIETAARDFHAADERGRLRMLCARPRAFGGPQDGMRPASIHDDFRRSSWVL